MTFNMFWALLLFVLLNFLFFHFFNCTMCTTCKFITWLKKKKKKNLENMIIIIIRSCNQWIFWKSMCYRYYLPEKIKMFSGVLSTTGKIVSHLIELLWESKLETFYEATSKETCFSLYLEKGKVLYNYFG